MYCTVQYMYIRDPVLMPFFLWIETAYLSTFCFVEILTDDILKKKKKKSLIVTNEGEVQLYKGGQLA